MSTEKEPGFVEEEVTSSDINEFVKKLETWGRGLGKKDQVFLQIILDYAKNYALQVKLVGEDLRY